jgi:predicted PurR-regulated permease PerM
MSTHQLHQLPQHGNMIPPLIICRGSTFSYALIFFGVLGNALSFGLIGVLIGPTLLAVAYCPIEERSSARTSPAD